jgi:ribosomal protein S20
MAVVYRALQLSTHREVALKILRPEFTDHMTSITRFVREARAAAKLSHPNVVRAIDVGRALGRFYFAMELVEGRSAAELLREQGTLPEREALRIARGVAAALEHAHEAGLVHRDIKPANILIARDGTPKLADLGLVRPSSGLNVADPSPGVVVGTPLYMSPEQVRGDAAVDGRSDIYALGATLFHLVTGRPPFVASTPSETMAMHVQTAPPNARRFAPEVSLGTAALIQRAMAKWPENRYANAGELLAELGRIAAGRSAQISHERLADARHRVKQRNRTGWRRFRGFIAPAVMLVLIGLGAVHLVNRREAPPPVMSKPPAVFAPAPAPAPMATPSLAEVIDHATLWASERPDDYVTTVQRCQALAAGLPLPVTPPGLLRRLNAALSRWDTAARLAFTPVEAQAMAEAVSGDYDAAMTRLRDARNRPDLPAELGPRVAGLADETARHLGHEARTLMETAIAQAREQSAAGDWPGGLMALDRVAHLRYAPLTSRVRTLRRQLAAQAEAHRRSSSEAALNRLLDAIDEAVSDGQPGDTVLLANAALNDPALMPLRAQVKRIASVAEALRRAQAFEDVPPSKALIRFVGAELTLDTRSGVLHGVVKEVTDETLVVSKQFFIDGEPGERLYVTALSDIKPESLAALMPRWEPANADEHIAAAMRALARGHLDQAEGFLAASVGHPLHKRYTARLEALRLDA